MCPSPLCSTVSAVIQFVTKIEFSYSSKAIFYSFSFPCMIRSKGTPVSAQPLSMLLALTSPLSWGIIGVSYADNLYIASLVLIDMYYYRLLGFISLIGFYEQRNGAVAHPPVSFFTKNCQPPCWWHILVRANLIDFIFLVSYFSSNFKNKMKINFFLLVIIKYFKFVHT